MPSPFFPVRSAARSRLPDKTLGKVSASLPKHPQHSTSEHAHIHTCRHILPCRKQLGRKYAKQSTYQQDYFKMEV